MVGAYVFILYYEAAKSLSSKSILLAEFLDLTLEDVSKCIELIYTPIRKDALKGSCRSIVSYPVVPGMPFVLTSSFVTKGTFGANHVCSIVRN